MMQGDTIEYSGIKISTLFVNCCDTCHHRPFKGGYSGRKNNGFCEKSGAVMNRVGLCKHFERDDRVVTRTIGGLKAQAKHEKRTRDWLKEHSGY